MDRDIKDVIGLLMHILDGGETSQQELDELGFEAEGDLETALNEAYVALREFARDQDLRRNDAAADRAMRAGLERCLTRIVTASDPAPKFA
ncbi:hypothetical protein ACQR1I_16030 [Bradyrhizobium sp. HKCCYLS2038]|uniref:hypothetical protein n=1 Tax=unclassified Bradyrhizobium TaxID=2631580 RepID=UPI003EBFDDC8